jgi:hypothetical protein
LSFQQIPGWHGKCTPGGNSTRQCGYQKLIGAQHFNAGWARCAINEQRPWEFNSARDYNGHGTHTSSTAGGIAASQPRARHAVVRSTEWRRTARIAMYKALCRRRTRRRRVNDVGSRCRHRSAVADGVDVINYSISGTLTNFLDPAEVAYL